VSGEGLVEAVLVVVVLSDFLLLGASRLGTCIRAAAVQGVAAGLLPLLSLGAADPVRACALSGFAILLKGVVFPLLLFRVLRETGAKREVEPFVGPAWSLLAGVAAVAVSVAVCARLPVVGPAAGSTLAGPAGLSTLLIGLFVVTSRRKALTQALGFVVLENGVYVFGLALAGEVPLLVELGVLLDAFAAVYLLGIGAWHIRREFNDIDVDRLDRLKG
jgi:hydrogenase-4 component E